MNPLMSALLKDMRYLEAIVKIHMIVMRTINVIVNNKRPLIIAAKQT